MSRQYHMRTDQTWSQTMTQLRDTFRKWSVYKWEVNCPTRPRNPDTWVTQAKDERIVEVTWMGEEGKRMHLEMDTHDRNIDNLRVLYLGIEALRMNEERGLSQIMRDAYLQLPAPAIQRDPYEVLGVRPDTPVEDIEAMYRIKAKRTHPDAGGSDDAFKEIQAAWDTIKAEKGIVV